MNDTTNAVVGDLTEGLENHEEHNEGHDAPQEQGASSSAETAEMEADAGADAEGTEAPEHAPAVEGNLAHNNASNQPVDLSKDFFSDVRKLGRASGEGSSALPRLALRVIRAAADGVLSTEKPAGGKDDATIIYEAYTAEDSKKAEHSAGGAKANASKLRQLITMGCMTTCDPVDVADRAVKVWNDMVAQELKPKPLYAGLVDVARAQCDQDVALTDAAIGEALTKTPAEKSVEKEWKAIQKKVTSLVTGENSAGLKDQSEEALRIAKLVDEHVMQYEAQSLDQNFIALCMERGYTKAQAEDLARGAAAKGQ